MRDIRLQTPQRDETSENRRLKSTSELGKNLRKVTKKSLNHAFRAVSEEDSTVLGSQKEHSEVSDDNRFGESAHGKCVTLVNPADTHSSETVAISNLSTPSLSSFIITSDKHAVLNSLDAQGKTPAIESIDTECIEAELVIEHLREARIQVQKSKDMGPSKKLLNVLIEVIIEEFYGGRYGEKEWIHKLLSNNANVVFLIFMLGIFSIFMFWIFNSGAKGCLSGPTPT